MIYRKKILVVVDDDPDWRELAVDVAEDLGLGTLEAPTAEKALEVSRNYVVDAAIVDIFMPGKGGLWLIDQIKAQHPDIKIISASGGYKDMPPENVTLAADKIGADAILTKPVRVEDMESLLRETIGD